MNINKILSKCHSRRVLAGIRPFAIKIVALITILSISCSSSYAATPETYKSYVRGLLASRTGDMRSALKEYERVIAVDSEALSVYRDLALAYWQLGETEKALLSAEKLDSISDKNLDYQLFLGSFYLMAGSTEHACRSWEKALAVDPENETAMLYLAAYNVSGDPKKAAGYWEKFVAQEPGSAEGYFQLGVAQARLGSAEKAKESFRKVLSIKPDSIEAHISLAQIYEKEGTLVAAAQEYERSLELDPRNITILLYLGGMYYRMQNYSASEETFLKAKEVNPGDANIYYWLGILAEIRKDWPQAARCFEELSKKDSNTAVLMRLSFYYSIMKNHSKAVQCLQKVAKIDQKNPSSYYLLGLAYFDMKSFRNSEKNFLTAVKLKPDAGEIYFNLGVLYDQWEKFPSAVKALEKAIELNPDNAIALNYLGYSYADRNMKLDEAETLVKKALSIDPGNGAFRDSLGWVYYRKGQYNEAQKELHAATDKNDDPVIWEHMGDVCIKLESAADAWDCYQKALSRAPDNKDLKKKIDKVKKLVLPKTIQRKVLKRAAGNLMQIRSLKANILISGDVRAYNVRSLGQFLYSRPAQWRLDVLGGFLAPRMLIIQDNGSLSIYPKALDETISPIGSAVIDKLKDFFNASLIEEFDNEATGARITGNYFYYHEGDKMMLIDSNTGTLCQYKIENQIMISFRNHSYKEGLYVPQEIEVYIPHDKIHVKVSLRNVILNETLDKSSFEIKNNEIPGPGKVKSIP